MTRDQLIAQLVEFFKDDLSQDAAGVGDWISQGDFTQDEFFAAMDREFPGWNK